MALAEDSLAKSLFSAVKEPGFVRGFVEFPVYSFYLGSPDINGVAFVPNFSPRVGANVSWKNLGVSLSVALPLPPEEIERRGKTDQFNLLLSKYWRAHGMDLYFQNYRGFYISNPIGELNLNKPDRNPQLPDAEITNYGLNYYYVLSPENYSLMAAFSQMEFQNQSGGSFILTVFYNHLEMSRGQKFIPGSDPDSLQAIPSIESGIFDSAGAGGGYGYTFVREGYFLTVQGIIGLGAQNQKIGDVQSLATGYNFNAALKANANAAIGYNRENSTYGAKVLVDTLLSDVRGTQVYSTLVNGIVFYGHRF